MTDIIKKALNVKRESKHVEFKECFDPNSDQDWCELIKDIIAIANSGGGVILFGVDNAGQPCNVNLKPILQLDPANIANKISKYIGSDDLEIDVRELKKARKNIVSFVIQSVSIPIIFCKPGTYSIGAGKQKSAFGVGTVYFRHGAKSEPGTSNDIRKAIDRQLHTIRKSWIKGVRKVVQAPAGSQIITAIPLTKTTTSQSLATKVRAVSDPKATPVILTRDKTKSSGIFFHEELSEGIFDEINNIIDANNLLARNKKGFFFGQPIYYRIYAERSYVQQNEDSMAILLNCALSQFYAPWLYWAVNLKNKPVAYALAELYRYPTTPKIHNLLRIALLLGNDFCDWLYGKWEAKWGTHSQPPQFYWTFKTMIAKLKEIDPRVIAARTSITAQISVPDMPPISVKELLDKPDKTVSLLSNVCMKIFDGNSSMRSVARDLDFFAYGLDIQKRSYHLSNAIIKEIGDQESEDVKEKDEHD
jgi:hypothetical protein